MNVFSLPISELAERIRKSQLTSVELCEHYILISHKLEFMAQIKKWEDINSYFINLRNRINRELAKEDRSNLRSILAKVNELHKEYAKPYNKLIAVEGRNILQNKETTFIKEMNELYEKFTQLKNHLKD